MKQLVFWNKKFCFLLIAVALSAIDSPSAVAQSLTTDLYGVVEIGGKGVKASLIQLTASEARDIEQKYSDQENNFKYELFGKSEKQSFEEINTNISLGEENVGPTANAVQALVKRLEEEGSVVRDNIFIVFSSSVARLGWQAQLARNIASQTKIAPDAITADMECELTYRWIVPKYRRDEAVVIDIGSGNTKACYMEAAFTSGEQMRAFELLPFGTVSLAKDVQKTMKPGETGFTDFLASLARANQFRVVPELSAKKQNYPGLGNLSRVYLVGGIVYAASTLVHPERSGESWVKLAPRDFDTLMNRFKRDRGFEVDLSRIPEAQTGRRDHASKQALRVKSLFSQEQMAAGLSMLSAMTDQLRFDRKAIFFASVARDAWRAQYLVDKIARSGPAGRQ